MHIEQLKQHFEPWIASKALEVYSLLPAGVELLAFLAGGALRSWVDGNKVKDYDLFFASLEDWQLACAWFRSDRRFTELTEPGQETYPTFHRQGHPPFNVIGFRFHRGVRELAESFDFRCCGFAAEKVDFETVSIYAIPGAFEDALTRTLRINVHQPLSRVTKRALHYHTDYGYSYCESWEEEMQKCAAVAHTPGSPGSTY